jgi:gamma-glutamylcyclotransferase (GGCT)/AIG2-like uncharacterized protein YtfP
VNDIVEPAFLLLYGSLRRGEPMFAKMGLDRALEYVREVEFPGDLYDLGDYPGAVAGGDLVHAELYRLLDADILEALDCYEEFDPARPAESLYLRKAIPVPGIGDAWVYLYNRGVAGARRIAGGDWRKRRTAA